MRLSSLDRIRKLLSSMEVIYLLYTHRCAILHTYVSIFFSSCRGISVLGAHIFILFFCEREQMRCVYGVWKCERSWRKKFCFKIIINMKKIHFQLHFILIMRKILINPRNIIAVIYATPLQAHTAAAKKE